MAKEVPRPPASSPCVVDDYGYKNFPVAEVLENMGKLAVNGVQCFVKYTCSCGSRQTSDEANTWRKDGYVCSECGALNKPTHINFMAAMGLLPGETIPIKL